MTAERRVVVGISGASGAILGVRILQLLGAVDGVEAHVVISMGARRTLEIEVGRQALAKLRTLCAVIHDIDDLAAPIASGSFRSLGMIVAPCSMRTLSAIAYAHSDNLLSRAADVALKERRRLVLLTREAPLHGGHIEAMLRVANLGGIIFPPVPAFYAQPQTIDQMATQIGARAIELIGLDMGVVLKRWGEQSGLASAHGTAL